MSNIPDILGRDMTAFIKDTHDLATAIRARRKQLKMTQAYLASMMGVSRQLIGELEKGMPGVNVGLALDVCRELGLKLGYEDTSDDKTA
jgi:putative transcriptional regulator|tara:strand:- start:478 stop:744 length:267 start_codon:yes stop_codon:yes gene_type:complete